MNSFKKSIAFILRNFLLIIPIYTASVIPQLIVGNRISRIIEQLTVFFQAVLRGELRDPFRLLEDFMVQNMSVWVSLSVASCLGFLLMLLAVPVTLGLIKKGIKNPPAGLQDSLEALKLTFLPFLLWMIGVIVLTGSTATGLVIALVILGLILSIIGSAGMVVLLVIMSCVALAAVYFVFRLVPWLPAMVLDGVKVISGIKQGFAVSKGSFWILLGITLLISIVTAVMLIIFSFLNHIPVIGTLVTAAIAALGSFSLLVFYLVFYNDKTQATALREQPAQPSTV